MSVKKVEKKIERKVAQKNRILREGDTSATLSEVEKDLARLYAELRLERARSSHGARDTIVRRARTERELEKLMAD